jgi:hypothetical protein
MDIPPPVPALISVAEARHAAYLKLGTPLKDLNWIEENPDGDKTRVTVWRWDDNPKRFDIWVDNQGLVSRLLDTTPHELCPAYAHTRYNGVKPITGTKNGASVKLKNDLFTVWDAENGFWLPGYSPIAETDGTAEVGDGGGFLDRVNYWPDQGTPPFDFYPPELRTPNAMTPAGEVAYGMEVSLRFFDRFMGIKKINPFVDFINASIHGGFKYDNAFYAAGMCECLFFGDGSRGDGNSEPGDPGFKNLTSLDIVSHELTHAVNYNGSRLYYWGDAGGMNEGNSDVFAKAIEFWADGGETNEILTSKAKDKWLIGKDMLFMDGKWRALRFMYKPSLDGYSFDYADTPRPQELDDPHFTSGPLNRWFFFMCEGVDHENGPEPDFRSEKLIEGWPFPVGGTKALKIWAATQGALRQDASYSDAYWMSLRFAEQFYGADSPEVYATRATWAAVGAVPRKSIEAVVTRVSNLNPVPGEIVAIRGGGFYAGSRLYIGDVLVPMYRVAEGELQFTTTATTPSGKIVVENGRGRSYAHFTLNPVEGPYFRVFAVDKRIVQRGESVTVTWSVQNAAVVTLDGVIVTPDGSLVKTVTNDHQFTLQANGSTRILEVLVRDFDINSDGKIDVFDALEVVSRYGKDGNTDLDGNGTTDNDDLNNLLGRIK